MTNGLSVDFGSAHPLVLIYWGATEFQPLQLLDGKTGEKVTDQRAST